MIESQHWEARVTFLTASRPQDDKYISHEEVFRGKTRDEAIEQMVEYTGELPKNPRKMYRDGEDGEPIVVGYIWAGWVDSYDRANPGRKHWEERWAEIVKVKTQYGLAIDMQEATV